MLSTGNYVSCNIVGDGKLFVEGNNKTEKFKIIDMSAAGISLETTAKLPVNKSVMLKIRLIGDIIDGIIDVKGNVVKTIEKGYEIEFIGLTDTQITEIDEIIHSACNIDD